MTKENSDNPEEIEKFKLIDLNSRAHTENDKLSYSEQLKKTRDEKPQITSVSEIKPEIKEKLNKLIKSIPEENIRSLISEVRAKQNLILDQESNESFSKLNEKDQQIILNTMAEWEVSDELSSLNASVILSWISNTIDNKE